MITESLINYIKNQFNKNISRELIISQLSKVGWHMDDIEEGLAKVESLKQNEDKEETSFESETKNIYQKDPYHESIDPLSDLPASSVTTLDLDKIIAGDSNTLKKDYPNEEKTDIYKEPIKEETNEELEIEPREDLTIPNEEIPKIWTPKAINPVNEVNVEKEETIGEPKKETSLGEFHKELNKPKENIRTSFPKDLPPKRLEPFEYQRKENLIPDIKPKSFEESKKEPLVEKTVEPKAQPIVEPVSESLAEKTVEPTTQQPAIEQKKEPPKEIKKEPIIKTPEEKTTTSKVQDFIIPNIKQQESVILQDKEQGVVRDISKKAMISSYSQDYMSANKLQQKVVERKKHNFFKWVIVFLIIVILGGLVFAFSKGYIKILGKDISFVNKEPQDLLLNNINKFDALTSYKVETEVNISLPLFANITSSLMSGEAVVDTEKEFFSYKVLGKVNKNNRTESFSDYDIILNSSMLKDEIKTNIKSDRNTSFITVPNLEMIFNENTPPKGVVSVPTAQINQINAVIPEDIRQKMNNIDITKLIPKTNSNYMGDKILTKSLVKDFEIFKKEDEEIHNIETTHYVINIEDQSLKNLLNEILDEKFADLSLEQKTKTKENLGSVSVKSLEFWVGKKDEIIYRYKFSLSIPLSKVVGLEDKSIANNEVTLDWQTTYYDLNVFNEDYIFLESMSMSDFLKQIADMKIKNTLSSFTSLAKEMKSTIGSYGTKSNVTGSCIKPAEGSVFSPLGHSKKASSVVGRIADTMNSVVNKLSGDPQCFSTSKAWSLASPLVSDPNKYFCIDSLGNSRILDESLSTTICE